MANKKPLKRWLMIGLVLAFSVPSVLGVFGPGLYSLHDDLHVGWIDQMVRAIQSGQLPPRWVPDLSYGYGYPLFNFVYPLPFYLGAAFYFLGLSLVGSLKAVFVLSIFASALAMFGYARRHFGNLWAVVVSLVYVYTPYRALTLYVRGTIGEALVFVFLPLVAWGLEAGIQKGGRGRVFAAGVAVAGLLLVHNIGAYMSLPFLAVYGVLLVFQSLDRWRAGKRLAKIFGWGLALSAYFWLPAVIEKRFMVEDTVFNYFDHFPFIRQLIVPSWGYGISIWGPADEMSFQVGVVNLVLIVLGLMAAAVALKKKALKDNLFLFWLVGSTLLVMFLMNIRSSFLWRAIPLLPYFQFPWRFLMMTTFFTPLMLPLGLRLFTARAARRCLGMVLGLVAFGLTMRYFQPQDSFPERTDAYFLTRYLPNWSPSGLLESATPAYHQNREEYLRLPLTTQARPEEVAARKVEISAGEVEYRQVRAVEWVGEYAAPPGSVLALNQYAFPGWTLEINGERVPAFAEGPAGRVAGQVMAPQGNFRFVWQESPVRRAANAITAISGLFAGMRLVSDISRRKQRATIGGEHHG